MVKKEKSKVASELLGKLAEKITNKPKKGKVADKVLKLFQAPRGREVPNMPYSGPEMPSGKGAKELPDNLSETLGRREAIRYLTGPAATDRVGATDIISDQVGQHQINRRPRLGRKDTKINRRNPHLYGKSGGGELLGSGKAQISDQKDRELGKDRYK